MKDNVKITKVIMDKVNDLDSLFEKKYYVLFFYSCKDKELYAYDTKDPIRAHKDITGVHPEYEFLRVEVLPTETAVRDLCKIVRQGRELREKLIPLVEHTL